MSFLDFLKKIYHFASAVLAVVFYGYPAKKLRVIAVTGTSGKTTTAHLIYSILKNAGRKVSLISSVKSIIGGKEYDTGLHVTTPTAFSMQKFLAYAVASGDTDIVIEASSHGIAQYRMFGTNVRIGVLTNIAHEHLDWHKTFANYANTKLFFIAKAKFAVVNKDDDSYQMLLRLGGIKAKIITYALNDKDADFTSAILSFKIKLPGDYNKQNILAAFATAVTLGIDKKIIKKAISNFEGIIGRFEEIKNRRGLRIIVDFAHKPNAFEAFLQTIKKEPHKKIIIVFGSAGLRDIGKRSMMGEIAAKYADVSIITAEDPRTEDVNKIIEQIAQGFLANGAIEIADLKPRSYFLKLKKPLFIRIPDRAEAIDIAINKIADKGDILAFLGKSHEKSMCYGTIEYPWSEHEAIYKALSRG